MNRPFPPLDVAVGIVVRRGPKVLAIRRADGRGWGPVTGRVEAGESLRCAAEREVCEETGLEVELGPAVDVWLGEVEGVSLAVVCFFADCLHSDLVLSPELVEARWVTAEQYADLSPFTFGDLAALVEPVPVSSRSGQLAADGILRADEVRTRAEVDFLVKASGMRLSDRVAVLGCGGGRHMAELARRGFGDLFGIDLDGALIRSASERMARYPRVNTQLITGDYAATSFYCDHAFAWFGVFGYGENRSVTRDLAWLERSICPGGTLTLDLVRRDFFGVSAPMRRWVFDGRTFVFEVARRRGSTLHSERLYVDLDGPDRKSWRYVQQTFSETAVATELERAGFQVDGIYGDESGRDIAVHRQRMLIVGRRKRTTEP